MAISDQVKNILNRAAFLLLHIGLILIITAYGVMLFVDAPGWKSPGSIFKALFSTYNPLNFRILSGWGVAAGWMCIAFFGAISLGVSFISSEWKSEKSSKKAAGICALLGSCIAIIMIFSARENRIVVQVFSFLGIISALFSYILFVISSDLRVRAASDFIISIFLALCIFFMVNVYAGRNNRIYDVSSAQFYSLSETSRKLLDSLDKNVRVYVILQHSKLRKGLIANYTEKLFKQIEHYSDRLSVEYLQPRSSKADTLLRKYNIREYEAIIFESGERTKAIPIQPNGSPLAVFGQNISTRSFLNKSMPEIKAYKGENIFYITLNEITSDKRNEIAFIEGHGERSISSFSERGLTGLEKELKKLNYSVFSLSLERGEIPVADALVIAGPRTEYLDWEISTIERFLKETNGSLLYFAEPILADKSIKEAGLAPLLTDYGIGINKDMIISYAKKFRHPSLEFSSSMYGNHPITRNFTTEEVFLVTARSLKEGVNKIKTMKTSSLLSITSFKNYSVWGEVRIGTRTKIAELGAEDNPPPLDLAVVSGPRTAGSTVFKTPKIAVIGDVDIISNINLQKNNNLNFVLNTFNWAVNPENIEKIPPKDYEFIKLDVNDDIMGGITQLVVFGIPGFILLFGLLVLIRRSS